MIVRTASNPNENIYMGAPVPLCTLPNGAVTNDASRIKRAITSYITPTVDKVADGVTVFGGHSFLNLTVIEGPTGLIVFDSGEHLGDGTRLIGEIRSMTDKPIVAIIYSHCHYVHGTTALLEGTKDVPIIGHPNVNRNMISGGSGTLYDETGPIQISRTLQQFNRFTPQHGEDAAAGAEIHFGRSGFLPVNTPVQHRQKMTLGGVEMMFLTKYGSDSDDCLSVYLIKSGVILTNLVWPFVPNIYTLRGSKFRDPREWADGLKEIRDLGPRALVSTHARAVIGQDKSRDTLISVIDGLSAIIDQTLRGILHGLGPEDLRQFVRLPKHLAEHPHLAEIYGEVSHFGPYIYNNALGWFDGDAATINPLPPLEQAQRLVAAIGGRDCVFDSANAAFEKKEYAWAAQLINYLYRLDPIDLTVRNLKADILTQMGRITPAHTIRSWYLSQARALRGEVSIPRLQFPGIHVLGHAPLANSMDQFRVRIDLEKSAEQDLIVVMAATDTSERHAWHLRRGVVEFVAELSNLHRTADIEFLTPLHSWLNFFACRQSLAAFMDQITVNIGTKQLAEKFFASFDFFDPADNSIQRMI